VFFPDEERGLSYSFLKKISQYHFSNGMPWSTSKRILNINNSSNLCHFGPMTKLQIENQLLRFRKANNYLLYSGYKPEYHYDGFVRGFFLVNNDDYRFIVTSGKHTVPSFFSLGLNKFKAVVDPYDFIPIVDVAEINKWPQIQSGMYSNKEAMILFENYFYNTNKQANRLQSFAI
jgi:hypothetical protein